MKTDNTNRRNKKATDHKGNVYESIAAMCRAYNISEFTFSGRLKKGWSLEKALTEPIHTNKVCDADGKEFDSIKDMCRYHHVTEKTFSDRKKRGLSLADCLKEGRYATKGKGNHVEVERHARERVGTKIKQAYGGVAVCITYRSAHDFDIRYEDGREEHAVRWDDFTAGKLKEGTRQEREAKLHIGQKKIQNCGQECECTDYKNKRNCTFRLDDGTVVNSTWDAFAKGYIAPVSQKERRTRMAEERIGVSKVMHDGNTLTCIRYGGTADCDFRSSAGNIIRHRAWNNFEKETIRSDQRIPDDERVGYSVMQNSGHMATCTEYISSQSKDNKFRLDDGRIVTGSWGNFMSGHIGGVSSVKRGKERQKNAVGTIVMQKCGLRARCIRYEDAKDFDVIFEDGTDARKPGAIAWSRFISGNILYPGKKNGNINQEWNFHGYRVSSPFPGADGIPVYRVTDKTGKKCLMTLYDIMKRENIKHIF